MQKRFTLLFSLGLSCLLSAQADHSDPGVPANDSEGNSAVAFSIPNSEATSGVTNIASPTDNYSTSLKVFAGGEDTLDQWSKTYTLPDVELKALSLTSRQEFIERSGPTSYFVSADYLQQIRSIDPHQLLQRVPGLQIQDEEGFGLRPNIGIRGSGASRSSKILVMEDGVPTAPAPYTAPAAYYFPTMGRMNSAEVRMGSAGLASGPYTTGGVINLISTPIPTRTTVKMRAGVGSFNTRQVHMVAGDEVGRLGYMVEYFGQNSDGFKQLDGPNDNTGFDKRDIHIKLRYLLSNKNGHRHQLSAKFLNSQETSDETYLGLTRSDFNEDPLRRYAGSERDQMNTEFTGGHLTHTWTLPQSVSIVSTVYGHTFDRNWYKLDKVNAGGENVSISNILSQPTTYAPHLAVVKGLSDPNATLSVKANNRSYYSYGFQSRFNWQKTHHAIQAGIRLHTDAIDRFQWVDDYRMGNNSMSLINQGIPGTESNRIERTRVAAGFGEYTYENNRFTLKAGGRLEYISAERENYGSEDPDRTGVNLSERSNSILTFLPGASLDYNLNARSQLFASVVRGFTPPGNSSDADPEQSINSELGYRFFNEDKFQFQLTGFWHEFQNLLGSTLVAGGNPSAVDLINGGAARSMGLELYTKYDIHPRWPLEASYTYIQSIFQEDFESDFGPWGEVTKGDYLPYVSPHTFWGQIGYSADRWGIFAQVHYQTDMLSQAGADFSERPDAPLLAGRAIVSAQAQYQLSSGFQIYGRVNNLLDEVYNVALRPAGWRPGMPRYFELGAEYRFTRP